MLLHKSNGERHFIEQSHNAETSGCSHLIRQNDLRLKATMQPSTGVFTGLKLSTVSLMCCLILNTVVRDPDPDHAVVLNVQRVLCNINEIECLSVFHGITLFSYIIQFLLRIAHQRKTLIVRFPYFPYCSCLRTSTKASLDHK